MQLQGFEVRKEEKLICGLQRKKWLETVLHFWSMWLAPAGHSYGGPRMRSRNGQPCLYHDLLEEISASYGSAMEPGPKSEGSLKLQRWALLKHLAESPGYRINFGGAQRFSRFETEVQSYPLAHVLLQSSTHCCHGSLLV